MADLNNSPKNKKSTYSPNPLEVLRDLGKDFNEQIFNFPKKSYSGELMPGQSLEMSEVLSGEREKKLKTEEQLGFERRIIEEEKAYVESKTGELKLQINAIHEEVLKLAHATPKLSRELTVAAVAAPGDPSTYELLFLKHIFEFIKSFRKRVEKASVWLRAANSRAQKKNVWGANYKKHGAKYLLSGEHYLQRSAG